MAYGNQKDYKGLKKERLTLLHSCHLVHAKQIQAFLGYNRKKVGRGILSTWLWREVKPSKKKWIIRCVFLHVTLKYNTWSEVKALTLDHLLKIV